MRVRPSPLSEEVDHVAEDALDGARKVRGGSHTLAMHTWDSLMSGVLSQGAFRTCVIGAKVWRIVGPLLPLSDYYGGCKEFKLRPRLELI